MDQNLSHERQQLTRQVILEKKYAYDSNRQNTTECKMTKVVYGGEFLGPQLL